MAQAGTSLGQGQPTPAGKLQPMRYAILAYHAEAEVASWTAEEDAALMPDLNKVHDRLTRQGHLGPAARLGATKDACVSRCSHFPEHPSARAQRPSLSLTSSVRPHQETCAPR